MAEYTYLAYDLLTNTPLAELPLSGVGFNRTLNGAGEAGGKLKLSDPKVRKGDPITATEPCRTALYVDRDGVIVWGGIIWTRQYDPVAETLTLGANEFWSYFRRRFITDALAYSDLDQLTIARSLITWAQSKPNGNIGVQLDTTLSGVNRDLISYSYELKPVAEAVEDFATGDNGFDFNIDVAYENGVPAKTLRFGYPRLGRALSEGSIMFEFPGNALEPEWDEDGSETANAMYLQGEGEGEGMVRSVIKSADMLDAGFPLLDGQMAFKDTSDQTVLDDMARSIAKARKAAVSVPKMRVRANVDPVLGTYIPGDDARIRLTSNRFPTGLDTVMRIVEIGVNPPEPGQMESVDLTLGDAI